MLRDRLSPTAHLAAAVSSVCTIASVALAGGTGSFQLLGATALTPSGVSNDGRVVVGYNPTTFWYWTAKSGLVSIGGVSPSGGGAGVADVSDDGSVMGYTVLNPNTGKTEGAFYSFETAETTRVGNFGFSCDLSATSCWGVSGDGSTMVGLGWHNLCAARAYRHRASTGLVDLGTLFPGSSSRANACSGNGNVIVGWQDLSSGVRQGAVWTNGVEKLLYTNTGGVLGEAGGCSANGTWVVGLGTDANAFLGWRWSEGTGYQPLPVSPIAGFRGYPTDVTDDGARILMFYRTPFPPATGGEGYLWEGGAIKSLEVLAAEHGIAIPSGVRMALPLAISGDGYTIVGSARTPTGVQGFVLDLPRPVACVGDLNGDGMVSSPDITVLLSAWGTPGGAADLDGDGIVASSDITVLLSAWGTCP